jgi:hypothetical protein
MLIERERPSVIEADDLVNSVSELKSTVLDADARLGHGKFPPVQPNPFGHGALRTED